MTNVSPVDSDIPLEPADNYDLEEDTEAEIVAKTRQFWIDLAASNFGAGRSYQDAALTTQWERNADHFNNRHYRRSIYRTKAYRGRSKLFRPLTRSAERSSSAQFASGMFANLDVVNVSAANQSDKLQVAAAHIMQNILQHRLTKTIPWYLTCMGAYQDTRVYGPCCTYTNWDFKERKTSKNKMTKTAKKDILGNDIDGQFDEVESDEVEMETIIDEPYIDMVPPENLILDPECDWRNPIKSSVYVIRLVPMHLDDILARMDSEDSKTDLPEWMKHSKEDILSVSADKYNAVRQAREGDDRPDKVDSQDRDEFRVIWCHENFVRLHGIEFVYWTLGSSFLLTEPKELSKVYLTGQRPLTYGFSVLEAHRFSPSSSTELIAGLQTGVNDVANLRFDNIKLALNKRYIIRRGAAVDLEALMRSVPGGGITTDDPERDIKVVDTRDVTASSYKEQERMETESNDISGTFMGGAVQNNRSLNQTVGGMEMLSEGANSLSEFDQRTFVESWVKPQLELLIQYIQAYETDDVIFANAFDQSFKKLGYKYSKDEKQSAPNTFSDKDVATVKDKVLNDKLTINVNVGLGSTSPQKKVELLQLPLKSLAEIPGQLERLDGDEIAKEFFAAAGFQDGSRFLKGNKPGEEKEITEADLQAAREQGAEEAQDQSKMAMVEATREIGMAKIQSEREVRLAEIASKEGITVKQLEEKTGIEKMKDQTRRDQSAVQSQNIRAELKFKRDTGKPGI